MVFGMGLPCFRLFFNLGNSTELDRPASPLCLRGPAPLDRSPAAALELARASAKSAPCCYRAGAPVAAVRAAAPVSAFLACSSDGPYQVEDSRSDDEPSCNRAPTKKSDPALFPREVESPILRGRCQKLRGELVLHLIHG